MLSPRAGSPRRSDRRKWSLLAGAAVLGLAPLTGCQVEYAGMTLPSGKYMHDDVQYFSDGPAFPWANTQAATQRARMSAMGMTPPPPPGAALEANPVTLPPNKNIGPPPMGPGVGAPDQGAAAGTNPNSPLPPAGVVPPIPKPKPVPPPAGAPEPPPE